VIKGSKNTPCLTLKGLRTRYIWQNHRDTSRKKKKKAGGTKRRRNAHHHYLMNGKTLYLPPTSHTLGLVEQAKKEA